MLYCTVQLPFKLPVQILVQMPVPLLLELEANLLDQNVSEQEFELSRVYMKQPQVIKSFVPSNWRSLCLVTNHKILPLICAEFTRLVFVFILVVQH